MRQVILCGGLTALLLAGCSWMGGGPSGSEVIAQANSGDKIAFDVVKVDDSVVNVLRTQGEPAFHERFKKYIPPPDVKIAVGDTLSIMIWEAAANGLFGNSMAEVSVPSGVASRLFGTATSGTGAVLSTGESTTAFASDAVIQLLGLAAAGTAGGAAPASAAQGLVTPGAEQGLVTPGAAQGLAASGAAQGAMAPEAAQSLVASGGAQALAAFGGAQGLTTPGATQGFGAISGQEPGGATGLASRGFAGEQTLGAALAGAPASRQANLSLATPSTTSRNAQELLEHIAESGRPGTRIPDQQVGPDGAISIPYAGRITAAGRTTAEVERTIDERLAPKALEPHALVVIRRSLANSVSVAGDVVKGGRVPLAPGGERLLQVIAAAGGLDAPVHETFVELSRGGITATVPLATLVERPEEDIFAEPGDVLTLVRRRQTFSSFGATGKNTAISFNSAKLNLAEALAKAGGIDDARAEPQSVFLFRYEPVSLVRALGQPIATAAPAGVSPIVYRLDLFDAKSYPLAREFPVRDKDIIFVATAEGRRLYLFFSALSQVTGPVITGFLTCTATTC